MSSARTVTEEELQEREPIWSDHDEYGETGTPETETDTAETSEIDETDETQLEASSLLSEALSEASSISLDLIDDSTTHLHGLMKSIGADTKDPQKTQRTPEMVNAACNCAKQIHSLLRLKFDVMKKISESV